MIDVIIATYNRFDKACKLAESLIAVSSHLIKTIFIIDSTDNQTLKEIKNNQIKHILTAHKNQPMQRYIGFQKSSAENILFLDDDMEIVDEACIEKLKREFEKDIVAVAIHFEDKHQDTSLNQIEKSAFAKNKNILRDFFNWFTGYPTLPDGKLGKCGVRGKQPANGGKTEFVSGGAFAAKRNALYQNFNFQLFDLYHQKLGKGEDAIMGYTLSKQGIVTYLSDLLFFHNDQKDSAYSIDQFSFYRRVTFSRIYLSLERARLNHENLFVAKVHYNWHTAWRVLGLIMNRFIKSTESRKLILKGALEGWSKAKKYNFSFQNQIEF